MQKYKRVFSFSIVLLFLIGFWIIIGFVNFTTAKKSTSNSSLLPSDIDMVMSVNTQELIHTFLFDLLFKADIDERTAQLFMPEESQEISKLGADLSAEVVVFYDNWNNSSAKGVVLTISNEGDFKRYQIDGENTIKFSNSKYGVLIYLDDKASSETVTHYTQLAEKIVNSKKIENGKFNSKGLINLAYQGNDGTYLKALNLDLNIKNQTISIKGKGKLIDNAVSSSSKQNILNLPTSQKYFQIQTSEIPEDAMNYLATSFNKLGIEVPAVKSMQLLIYGVAIDEYKGSMAVLPNLDWILRFKEPFQIDSVVKNLHPDYKSLIDFENRRFTIGNVKYNYKQISKNEVYIGLTEMPDYVETEIKPYYSASGYPSAVLEIDGQGFVAGFIKMMPPVKLSKQFLEDVSYFDIRAEQVGDSLEIKGEISIKEGKLMTVEMAKYVMLLL